MTTRTELFRFNGAVERDSAIDVFQGAWLPDPARLLRGTGKFMRQVKLKPGIGRKRRSAKKAHRSGVLRYKSAS